MDALTIITAIAGVIKTAVELTPTVIKTVNDAKPFAEAIYNSIIKGNEVSEDQLAELEARLTELSNQLQLPLPPEEE